MHRRLTWLIFLLASALEAASYTHLPVRFEPARDRGFVVRAGAGTYQLAPDGSLRLSPQLEMRLAGGTSTQASEPSQRLPGNANDLRGHDPAAWRTGIPQYGRVRFAQVYPGIDLVYRGDPSGVEYDFEIGPAHRPIASCSTFAGQTESASAPRES